MSKGVEAVVGGLEEDGEGEVWGEEAAWLSASSSELLLWLPSSIDTDSTETHIQTDMYIKHADIQMYQQTKTKKIDNADRWSG